MLWLGSRFKLGLNLILPDVLLNQIAIWLQYFTWSILYYKVLPGRMNKKSYGLVKFYFGQKG